MQDQAAEAPGGILDRVDMTPIDLSFLSLGLHHSVQRASRSDTAGSPSLPGLTLEDLSSKFLNSEGHSGQFAQVASADTLPKSAPVQSDQLPALKLSTPEAAECRVDQPRIDDSVRATLGKFDDRVPGMMVRVPENYDPCKPINVLVYNHGFGSTAKSAIKESDLEAQMKNAPPNTVLVIPEWQTNPGSRSGAQGAFKNEGHFDHKMDEVFAKIPALQGRSVKDVANINIVSHSAGYGPTESEIYNNKLSSKVKSITLLDSLYDPTGFDKWLQDNIKSLGDGSKQFTNIYHGTADASVAQAHRVQAMLKKAGISQDQLYLETGKGKRIVNGDELARHPIVFKYSSATVGNLDPHASLPSIYLAKVNESSAITI